jgi:hypothetical protein
MTPGLISLSKTTAPRAGSAAAIADHLMTPVYSEPLTFKPPPVEVGRIIRSWHRRQGRAPRAQHFLDRCARLVLIKETFQRRNVSLVFRALHLPLEIKHITQADKGQTVYNIRLGDLLGDRRLVRLSWLVE